METIQEMDTRRQRTDVDLNLLGALDVLVQERSVTLAGKRLGLSQPAMSYALARLRELLHDPVLVRTSNGMVPTPRALELAGPVRAALDQLRATLEPARRIRSGAGVGAVQDRADRSRRAGAVAALDPGALRAGAEGRSGDHHLERRSDLARGGAGGRSIWRWGSAPPRTFRRGSTRRRCSRRPSSASRGAGIRS